MKFEWCVFLLKQYIDRKRYRCYYFSKDTHNLAIVRINTQMGLVNYGIDI